MILKKIRIQFNALQRLTAWILVMILVCCSFPGAFAFDLPDKESRALNEAIMRAPEYRQEMKMHIDSMQKKLSRVANSRHLEKSRIALEISRLYRPMSPDSAVVYADYASAFAHASGDSVAIQQARIAKAGALATGGLFVAAMSEFLQVKTGDNETLKIEYWKAGRLIYSYMKTYAQQNPQYHSRYEQRYLSFDDSLLRYLPRTDLFYIFIRSERLVKDGDYNEAKRSLTFLLDTLPENRNLYGMAAFQMAELYRIEREQELYATFLAKAATSDIKCCVREGMALPTLAEWLYNQGKFDEAFRYVNFAISDVSAGNTRMSAVAITPMIPLIDNAYRDKLRLSQVILTVALISLIIILVIVIILLVNLHRQRTRSRQIQQRLTSLSRRQESYIGNFLSLCSTYADRLDTMAKVVGRKLSAGQSEELLKMVNAGKFTEENDEFYRIIDHAFLDMYPDFIFEINKLLRDDAKLPAREGFILTPELRIYAFVRLGVEESTRIAQILHYSVSTVYAYRNRMRNRAIDRENFDKNVMNIGREHPVD